MTITTATTNKYSALKRFVLFCALVAALGLWAIPARGQVGVYPASSGSGSLAPIATSGSATDLSTGTVPAARLPNPSASTLGGVQSKVAVTHQFLTTISTVGVPSSGQPACADISDAGTGCSAVKLAISGFYLTDGTSYYGGPHFAAMTLPVAGNFSWLTTQGTGTETAVGNALVLYAPATSGDNVRMRGLSIGSNTTLTSQFSCTSKTATFIHCGIAFRESATGKIISLVYAAGSTTTTTINLQKWTNATTLSTASTLGATAGSVYTQWMSVRLVYTSGSPGTIKFYLSSDDTNWVLVFSENANSFFTTAPNQWGYMANANNTVPDDVYTTLYSFLAN